MLKAYVHSGDFNRNSTFATWFTRISINSALMIPRKKRARPEISTDAQIDESFNPFQREMADRRLNPDTTSNLKSTAVYSAQFPSQRADSGT
jgi:RNA polymerase sigma-70 factor (ECF subfamily)